MVITVSVTTTGWPPNQKGSNSCALDFQLWACLYCAMYKVKVDPYGINFGSIEQCLNMLRNVRVYCTMSEVKVDPHEITPNTTVTISIIVFI